MALIGSNRGGVGEPIFVDRAPEQAHQRGVLLIGQVEGHAANFGARPKRGRTTPNPNIPESSSIADAGSDTGKSLRQNPVTVHAPPWGHPPIESSEAMMAPVRPRLRISATETVW